jgi:hypothetical protein
MRSGNESGRLGIGRGGWHVSIRTEERAVPSRSKAMWTNPLQSTTCAGVVDRTTYAEDAPLDANAVNQGLRTR